MTSAAIAPAAGVREYWIADPEAQAIEVLALVEGAYVRHGIFRRNETLSSLVLEGFVLAMAQVFAAR